LWLASQSTIAVAYRSWISPSAGAECSRSVCQILVVHLTILNVAVHCQPLLALE
jgi:hypothetical protein